MIHQGGAVTEAKAKEEEPKAEIEEENEEKEVEENNENPDVLYEANFMQDQRILDVDDDDDDNGDDAYSSNPTGESEELKVVDPPPPKGENEDSGWQIQNAYRQKKKLERIMIRELSKTDVMPDERAKLVSNVIIVGRKRVRLSHFLTYLKKFI